MNDILTFFVKLLITFYQSIFYTYRSFINNISFVQVIIVDDGSKDKTTQIGLDYSKKYGSDKVSESIFRVLGRKILI